MIEDYHKSLFNMALDFVPKDSIDPQGTRLFIYEALKHYRKVLIGRFEDDVAYPIESHERLIKLLEIFKL